MKIRNGFVSNSSSSSFCILGVPIDDDMDLSGTSLRIEYGISEHFDRTFIGYHPSQMKDDETMGEFKKKLVNELENIGVSVNVKSLNWYEDGGYDG